MNDPFIPEPPDPLPPEKPERPYLACPPRSDPYDQWCLTLNQHGIRTLGQMVEDAQMRCAELVSDLRANDPPPRS